MVGGGPGASSRPSPDTASAGHRAPRDGLVLLDEPATASNVTSWITTVACACKVLQSVAARAFASDGAFCGKRRADGGTVVTPLVLALPPLAALASGPPLASP